MDERAADLFLSTGLPVEMGSAHCWPPPASGGWTELSEAETMSLQLSTLGRGDPETRLHHPSGCGTRKTQPER